ncbi:MAG: low affinity iron permease family protein [Chloroflexota bacterium]
MQAWVRMLARLMALVIGTARAFIMAGAFLAAFVGTGALFDYSDRWLALFSASLSGVTFLLVFLLQYRENRDTAAIQLKLNELLRAVEGARDHEFLDVEHLPEEEQEDAFRKLRDQVRAAASRP